jgi:hypothetical protein
MLELGNNGRRCKAFRGVSLWTSEAETFCRKTGRALACYQPPPFPFLVSEEDTQMRGTTVPLDTAKQQSMVRLEALARLMDGAFVIPGTTIRFGLDGIIGLIPVAGDMIAGLVSTYLVWEAHQLGAPAWLIARMLGNVFLDTAIGSVPVVGDAFDVLFRANMKNMALLRRHLEKKGYAQPVRGTVIDGDAVRVS